MPLIICRISCCALGEVGVREAYAPKPPTAKSQAIHTGIRKPLNFASSAPPTKEPKGTKSKAGRMSAEAVIKDLPTAPVN